jgi:Pentapeptide repeats (8 copies)/NACHT domain
MANSLWRFLTTDIKELAPTKMLDGTTSAAKVVFDLAAALKPEKGKPQVEQLAPIVNQLDSLLDVLNSPLGEVVEKSIPFVPLATGLLRFYLEKSKVPLTLENCIALIAQAAYLESFKFFLEADQSLLKHFDSNSGSDAFTQKLKSLAGIDVDREMASEAATQFPTSKLAQSFGVVLQARLEEAGLSKKDAQQLTERVNWYTPRYLNEIWSKSEEAIKHLGQPTFVDWRTEQERYQSLEDYLKKVIQPGPDERVFGESSLTFRHLYVPLEIERVDGQGKPISSRGIGIEEWVEEHLLDSTKKEILFIQGEAGRGKSVFCRMFADRLRTSLYPSYTPILIRLREIRHLSQNFSDTLKNILQNQQFVTSDNNWLTRKDTRFLFFLDGFDELLLEGRGDSGGLKEFLQQVEQFQLGSHHRFIITGRSLALQRMERLISQVKQLQRVELQPMSDLLKKEWFSRWATQFSQEEADAFQHFLRVCPRDVGDVLAREPLLLYLLGRMHREERLNAAMFKGKEGIQAKVVIYNEVVRWVIEEQRKDGKDENFRLVGLRSEDLRDALTEVAVCVMQSGNEVAKVSFLEARLLAKDENNPMYSLLRKAHQDPPISEKKLLNNVLTTFYIKPAEGDREGSVEFAHKSFGEFLFAERLAYALEDWSKRGKDRRSKWSLSDEVMHREIYDLLGYGSLSKEVVNYVMAMLKPTQTTLGRLENTQWCQLFDCLQDFYLRWWEGEFIDAVKLPKEKMLSLQEHIPSRGEPFGLRQVDVHTGLNVLILLFELHRYGQSQEGLKQTLAFYPCGQPEEKAKFEASRLNRIIGYSESIEARAFNRFISPFLREADLSGADLISANLSKANLIGANLWKAKLISAYLQRADIIGANLSGADLRKADLSGADIIGANLSDTNLSGADLIGADLSGADLIGANLSGANLSGANLHHLLQLDQAILCKTTLPDGTVSNRDCK